MTCEQQDGFMTRTSTSDVQRRSGGAALFLCACKQWLVQYMYEDRETVGRFAAAGKDGFLLGLGLHQKSTLSPFLLAVLMDRLADELRQESQQLCLLRTL